ncbi:type II toxin-antitoxin system HigA family antitoxin [Castellaniella defragrans]|uniref:HTH-type transcriptional regulator/antitoxin HigA n=1 Tax=Castellaniella defragrans TaxID=75697 RepID=A0A7W9TM28_CASDE|nr:transcriptional regulator [Castellaniella defragrans]KAB0603378.1 transcriptional regulator [Castellaniella defragrans]MBB6083215.1 HTH-type transcriptional regulator/antitoxin HigA [Castellaniella defragrans]
MELKLIRTQEDYRAALAGIDRLWDAPAGSPASDLLDVLALLVEQYERRYAPIDDPDPIDFLVHVMESRNLTRKDLEPYLGPRGRVSDILNRTRPLTLAMIRKLSESLKLPAEVLIRPYRLRQPDKTAATL